MQKNEKQLRNRPLTGLLDTPVTESFLICSIAEDSTATFLSVSNRMKSSLLRLLAFGALYLRSSPLQSNAAREKILVSKVLGCDEHSSLRKESAARHDSSPLDFRFGLTVRRIGYEYRTLMETFSGKPPAGVSEGWSRSRHWSFIVSFR